MSITSGINILEIASSAFNIINNLLSVIEHTVGYETLWCRATPELNSEDVILQEYTLTNIGIECPKKIEVILSNSDYNAGNFTVDLFGINYDAPIEINISIQNWETIFGMDTMPQLGDIVYIKMLHKLFEVKSSNIMYTIASMPTYFKCQLSKYNPVASRKESEQFMLTIKDMTVTQEDLFGDKISEEVADAVVAVETDYNTTSIVDPLKDYDVSSIIEDILIGTHGTEISHAYYSMSQANKPITYNVCANYSITSERKHWIFTNWFRITNETSSNSVQVKKLTLYMKEKTGWYFRIGTTLKLNEGDIITLKRGSLITIQGEVVRIPNEEALYIKFPSSEVNRVNKKITNWYETGSFKITKEKSFVMFYTNNNTISINVNSTSSAFTIKFGKYKKIINLDKKIDFSKWTYIAIDFSEKEFRLILELIGSDLNDSIVINNICDKSITGLVSCGDFEFISVNIPNKNNLDIRNIRLYENEYPIEDAYKIDMLSEITRNASKLILVDAPNVPLSGMFYSPVR